MSESLIRFSVFISLFIALVIAETVWPRRERRFERTRRWITNLTITVINTVAIRLLGPLTAVAMAAWALRSGWGLLNQTGWHPITELLIALIIFDFAIYLQHVAVHHIPILWRIHKVHHADRDIDVTTALRFHPVEIILSMLYKSIWVLLLGPSVLAIILFEAILNGMAMFNHANLKLPLRLDRILRHLIVTPDMHRVHHSVIRDEHNSNFGFNLSIWDRLFGTYKLQPRTGHDAMQIGLNHYQTDHPTKLGWSLVLPFRNGQ